MALSRLYYTYAESALDDITTSNRVSQSIVYGVKAFLIGTKTGTTGTSGAPPVGVRWTVDHSCDSTVAGTPGDGVDRWGGTFDSTKLVASAAGATPKSWFVLKSPSTITALSAFFYLTIGFQGADVSHMYLALSKTQPSGGTANIIPTSADTTVLWNSSQAFSDTTSGGSGHKMAFITGANGAFYVSVARVGQGKEHTILGVWDLTGPEITGDLSPLVVFFDSNSTGRGVFHESDQILASNGYNTGSVGSGTGMGGRDRLNSNNPGSAAGARIIIPDNASYLTTTYPNDAGKQEVLSCRYLWINSGITTMFVKGTLTDWWIANSNKANGLIDPPTGASELIFMNHIWVPNGGAVHVL